MLAGYQKGTAERRLFTMLSAFFDGSGPGHNNGRYVMAGFVAFCPTWATIAERWAEALADAPPIPKFKLSLSRNKDWRDKLGVSEDQMNDKIDILSGLVAPPKTLFSVICSISEPEFRLAVDEAEVRGKKDIKQALGKHAFNTAYMTLFHQVIGLTLQKIRKLGIVGDQVDFIFDRENELFDNANTLLRNLRRYYDPETFSLCGDAIQRDEDKVLPLQAADLIAGVAKDQCNDTGNAVPKERLLSIAGTADCNTTVHISEQRIRSIIAGVLTPMPEGWKPQYDWTK
jgi:hypothetical protein